MYDNVNNVNNTYHIKKKRFLPCMGFLGKYLSEINCVRDYYLSNVSSGHSTHCRGHIKMKVIIKKSVGLKIYRVKIMDKWCEKSKTFPNDHCEI
jgi:hypothetical protein